jgi:hypothetical protein
MADFEIIPILTYLTQLIRESPHLTGGGDSLSHPPHKSGL